mmetsp:Transcript_11562/g.13085  ORF Transcript_11562/g.13085 Transcript_11562/m.13085 type:complete len:179 (+) Transcript_11562:23-559(+)|eukprot:CAMPEP_0205828524 /NCGR_PEP_ID=MMETSP0206-20130828/35435_1 /ASSEMBLY_ACC=CAM_ASM_000279 /TAXON_ID=36767 /ORGANISM="Euplotes focardii, Strain TN1" /LENGTH=178 /DNA_ID=CAMNT_0053130449 /DNA_START=21 /DNA_END=557 /DNA_ORIENTATION=-
MEEDKEEEEEILGLDADDEEDEMITLKSKEGKGYSVGKAPAMMSNLIKITLDGDQEAKEIDLKHIEGPVVEKVIQYMTYHVKVAPRKIEKPLQSTNMKELVDEFDAGFVDTDQPTMFKLLLAANYLDIKSLLNLVCAKIASLMKGKTPDQIRKIFNIRSDYTPEEEEQVRRDHRDLIS